MSEAQEMSETTGQPAAIGTSPTVSEYVNNYWKRVKAGDLGPLPIILGLIVIAIIFQLLNQNYLTPRNFVNLIVQMAGITTIAIGVVYVLLLGEIDLSIGYVSAVAAVFLAMRLRPPSEWTWWMALIAALALAALIGMVQGFIITKFSLPSFVVTLAGFLVWNGVVLILIGNGGTVIIQDPVIIGIANYFLSPMAGWLVVGLAVVLFGVTRFLGWRSRRARGVSSTPLALVILQVAVTALIALGVVYVCNQDRGVPFVGVLVIALLVAFTFLAERTRFGRYIYAIGGNEEAARRAGINVDSIKIRVFMISSLMAGTGGIILASRLRSVDTAAGGGNLMLNSIAAAVIGGTSLSGGIGTVWGTIVGALIIGVLDNGLILLNVDQYWITIVKGSIIVVAVIIDQRKNR